MSRKEEIIYATLELASIHGLKAVSLSMIADKVGVTADTEPGDWTEIILSGRKTKNGKRQTNQP